MKPFSLSFKIVSFFALASCGQKSYDPEALRYNLTATDAVIKLLPPNDIGVTYSKHQIQWVLENQLGVEAPNSITVAADKEITLMLNPERYHFVYNLFHEGKMVASSDWGKCHAHQKVYPLALGANSIPLVICAGENKAGLVENRAALDTPRLAPTHTLIPKTDNSGFDLTQVESDDEEINDNGDASRVENLLASDDAVHLADVLVFGDSGTGSEAQYKMARTMQDFCAANSCNYGVMLGDNIYENGVSSPDDPQFKTKFEDAYRPLGIPFYVALGNHDYHNHSKGIQAQIAYSNISDIWVMKDRYFNVRLGDIEYFILDTNTFSVDKTQITWLKESMKASDARWKVVTGHHPMYSVGAHAMSDPIEGFPIERLRKTLEPIMCKNGGDMYLSGHDHHLEVNVSKCGVVNILSGAAAKTRETFWWPKLFNKKLRLYSLGNTLGFAHLSFFEDQAHLRMLDAEGKVLFEKVFGNR